MRVSDAMRAAGLALLLACLTAPAAAADTAEALLTRMAQTMRSGTYEGTFVYQRADGVETLQVAHAVIDGVEHERLQTLSGRPFEVIRAGEKVTCVWPRSSQALVGRRPEELLPTRPLADLAGLPSMYTAERIGLERVAGREADVIAIRPRDALRYGYRMWLGREDHLLLRSDLIGPDGAALERMFFTRVVMRQSLPAHRFDPDIDPAAYAEHYTTGEGAGTLVSAQWVPDEVPPGFEAVSHRFLTIPGDGASVQHSVYSDGLASVSVFVEPAAGESAVLDGLTDLGAVHAFGHRVGDHQVTVVGELPPASVRAIARSVRRSEGD